MFVLQRTTLRRDGQVVLRHAGITAPSPGLLFLVGPGGAGKSSLLAALAGQPEATLNGLVSLDGGDPPPLGRGTVWVRQHARLEPGMAVDRQLHERCGLPPERQARWLDGLGLPGMSDCLSEPAEALSPSRRRVLAVLAGLAADAALYLVDEPTADLDESDAERVRTRLRALAQRTMVLCVTHDRSDCLALGGYTALVAGGTVQEYGPTARLFERPRSQAARLYATTGNCALPIVHASTRCVEGIWWLQGGLLGGMSRPGLVAPIDRQFQRLAESGVRRLLCLEESCDYPTEALNSRGIALDRIPIPDMAPPSFDQAVHICRLVEPVLRENHAVMAHCRGGLGRTGTVLAATLIWHGDPAEIAMAKVRAARPLAIQTAAQSRFLYQFADRIQGWRTTATPPHQDGERNDVLG